MSETLDFVDIILPILEAGTWTNLGSTPKIPTKQKSGPSFASVRGNRNARIEVKNEDGGSDEDEVAFNGVSIVEYVSGQITMISTKKSDRNKMKTDVKAILVAAGVSFSNLRLANNPSIRMKDSATYFLRIIGC